MADTNFNIVGKIKYAAIASVSIIVLSLAFILMRGGLDYNIEFNGGYLVQVGFYEDVKIGELRDAFAKNGLPNVQLQEFNDASNVENFSFEAVIKVETTEKNVTNLENTINTVLDNEYGKDGYQIRQKESIGPRIGEELKTSAIDAIIFAIIGILIYITIKFRFRYGVAAIIAVFHDVLVTVGVFSVLGTIMNIEISLSVIAALLTIVGYSLNDTIVVFDRIRENIDKLEGTEFPKLVNISINETLRRTLLTSLTTLFVVLVLFLFGGEVIRDLSTALVIGVLVGTYSSIFIASPVVIWWHNRTLKKARA